MIKDSNAGTNILQIVNFIDYSLSIESLWSILLYTSGLENHDIFIKTYAGLILV